MFDRIKEVANDLKYGGVKFTIQQSLEYAKDNPGKTTACLLVDVAAKSVPGGTIVKKVGKAVVKAVVKDQIRK